MERPDFCTDEMIKELDSAFETGITDLYLLHSIIIEKYSNTLTQQQILDICKYWFFMRLKKHQEENK